MSNLLAKIMLVIFMIPAAAMVYLCIIVAGRDVFRELGVLDLIGGHNGLWPVAGVITWVFLAVYWWLIWRKTVQWTPPRLRNTGLITMASIAAGVISSLLIGALVGRYMWDFAIFVGSVVAPLGWLIGTTLIWKETADERSSRFTQSGDSGITCPRCGYNLTGLRGTRCPECGTEFNLDELVLSRRERVNDELEKPV